MKVFTYPIRYTYGDTIKLKSISDLHIGSPLFDKKAFLDYMSDVDDKTYIVGNGDFMDMIIASDVKRFKQGSDDGITETPVDEQVNKAYAILKPYAERIILIGQGNHEETIVKRCGTNPMKRLAEKLGCQYAGMKWMLRLNLREGTGRGRSVVVYGHHGYGGGTRTEGGNITKFFRDMAYDEADIYLFGHVHEKAYKRIPRGYHGGSKYQARDRLLVIGGSFKRNLTNDDTTTWEESKGFPIRAIGGYTIKITPTKEWVRMQVTE